jgi:hypothetical protein
VAARVVPSMHRLLRLSLIVGATAVGVHAAEPQPATPPAAGKSEWVFSLLPKSMQRNPQLELTVITEMTEAGRRARPVSAAKPAYVDFFTAGPKHLGHSAGNEKTLPEKEVEALLERALATNGYLRATQHRQPPELVILYTWGTHAMLVEGDADNPSLSGNEIARNLLDRAAMVGGEKFAREMLELFEQADALAVAASAPIPPGGRPVFSPEVTAMMNPVEQYKRRSVKNEALVNQSFGDLYYVVASAYDYAAMQAKRRLLLWRTRMTVASAGVSAAQTLPSLIHTAAPYLGREMAEPEMIYRRAIQTGAVEIGAATVIEGDVRRPPGPK